MSGSTLEETSASLEEMAGLTRQNAENARQTNSMADETMHSARQGSAAMQRMGEAIGLIKVSSDEPPRS